VAADSADCAGSAAADPADTAAQAGAAPEPAPDAGVAGGAGAQVAAEAAAPAAPAAHQAAAAEAAEAAGAIDAVDAVYAADAGDAGDAGDAEDAGEAAEAAETADEAAADVADAADADDADDAAGVATAAGTDATTAPRPPDLSPAACGARLAELFPALFGPEGPRKPIKLRIQADLQQRAPGLFSRRVLGLFLSRYTTTSAYLRGLSTSPHRFDLDGQPAGEIAEEHRAAAVAELARRREIVDARRAAERAAAQANRPPRPGRAPGAVDPSHPDRAREGHARYLGPPLREGRAAPGEGDAPAGRAGHGQGPGPGQVRGPGAERGGRPERGARPPAGGRPPRQPDGRPPRAGDRPDGRPGERRPERVRSDPRPAGRPPATPPEAPLEVQDPAQRERALLLRQFESSPLTKANFCVLKRIPEAELDTLLAQARAERPQAAAPGPVPRGRR
jgi:hypothetical protein